MPSDGNTGSTLGGLPMTLAQRRKIAHVSVFMLYAALAMVAAAVVM